MLIGSEENHHCRNHNDRAAYTQKSPEKTHHNPNRCQNQIFHYLPATPNNSANFSSISGASHKL